MRYELRWEMVLLTLQLLSEGLITSSVKYKTQTKFYSVCLLQSTPQWLTLNINWVKAKCLCNPKSGKVNKEWTFATGGNLKAHKSWNPPKKESSSNWMIGKNWKKSIAVINQMLHQTQLKLKWKPLISTEADEPKEKKYCKLDDNFNQETSSYFFTHIF